MIHNKKGFTLLELILVLGLLSTVMGVVSSFFFSGYFNLNKTEKKLDLQRNTQSIIKKLEEEVKSSIDFVSIKENEKNIYGFMKQTESDETNKEIYSVNVYYVNSHKEIICKNHEFEEAFVGKEIEEITDIFKMMIKSIYNDPSINETEISNNAEKFSINKDGDFIQVEVVLKDVFRGEEIKEEYSGRTYMRNQKDE